IEECSIEVPEEQKQKMEDTMFELVKIFHLKEFLCIHLDVDDLIESALDSKLLSINSINSQCLDKKEQEVKNVVEQPAERGNRSKIRLIENLLYDNSFLRPPEELNAKIADIIIESIPLLPIPVQDGDVCFLEELLINDSIHSHESNFENNPSNLRPPPEPPDDNFDLELEVISAVMEEIDEPDEHFNPGGEIFVSTNNEVADYFPFMFFIRIFLPYLILPVISPLLLSAESEDTIFDPGLSLEIEVIL
nr:hypothetical protein [Tanacetum cinerariifolium]